MSLMAVLMVAESRLPSRKSPYRWQHYRLNIALMVSNQLGLWLLLQTLSAWPENWKTPWVGPLATLPFGLQLGLGLLLLDGLIYYQHRLFHWIPWLWRLHAIHHSDPQMDVTSGVRFHVLELFLSLGYKAVWSWLLGIGWLTLAVFEIWLMVMALWTHSNIRLSPSAEHWLSYILVTPAFHLRHHSLLKGEQQHNFSGGLVWWDQWGKTTYPIALGDFKTGLQEVSAKQSGSLPQLWAMPWRPPTDSPSPDSQHHQQN